MGLKKALREGAHLRSAQYRRGTIMGLTVAECFILLAFILLLLLMLWRTEDAEQREKINDKTREMERVERLLENPPILGLLEKFEKLSPEELKFTEKYDQEDIGKAIRFLKSSEKGARLVEEETLLSLLEEIEKFPPAQRKEIIKLVSIEGYEEVIEWARKIAVLIEQGYSPDDIQNAIELAQQLKPDDLPLIRKTLNSVNDGARLVEEETHLKLLEEIEVLAKQGYSLDDIQNAFEIAKQLDPGDLASVEDLKLRIRRRLEKVEKTGRLVAEEIKQTSGPLVDKLGGSIDPFSGEVALPDRALFPQGRSDITLTLASFLDGFCIEWLGVLKKYGHSIESARIEGHASSEWKSDSAQTAFLKNMELSQARASNVLNECLTLSGDGELGQWGRSKLVAVGMSSSRPVLTEEDYEDREKSRRVVFRFEVDKEHILREIQEDVQASDAATKP